MTEKQKSRVVLLAADHNGVALKNDIAAHLKTLGYNAIDLGPYTDQEKVDYVDYARQLSRIIDNGDADKGILICGTGVGMSITANRFPKVRAALVRDIETAIKCREHNDANVLCLGAWISPKDLAVQIVENWLNEPFGEGRHVRRVEKITPHRQEAIVFTNGIFDVIHTGHIELLKFARSLGGKLIVGINSDRATKLLKGPDRPVNNENDRKFLLQSIKDVDEVVIFDEVLPTGIITQIKPDIVVKGGEWPAEEVRRRDKIPDYIEVKTFPLVKDYSTTNIIKKIKGNKYRETLKET